MENSLFMNRILTLPYCKREIKHLFTEQFSLMKFNKGQILTSPMHIHRMLYFLESGLVREYWEIQKSSSSFRLLVDGDFIIQDGALLKQPSRGNVDFLQDTTVYGVDFKRIEWFCKKHPDAVKLLLAIQEERIISGIEREYLLRIELAEDRYQYAINHHYGIIDKTPLHILASYLRLSRKHLGRLIKANAYRK